MLSEMLRVSTKYGGEAHLFGRRDIKCENKVTLMWPRHKQGSEGRGKIKRVRVWGQPRLPSSQSTAGYFQDQSLGAVLLPD